MLWPVCFLVYFCEAVVAEVPLYLLGLYPLTGFWPAGDTILAASQMAVNHVNSNSSILPGYRLVLIPGDSACNRGRSVEAMYRELYKESTTKFMILGPGCSVGAEPTAEASGNFWNLVQISYSAGSPELSQREIYPKFFRLCCTGGSYNAMRIAFIKHFGWRKVATIHQSVDVFTLLIADFRKRAEANNMTITTSQTFTDDPTSQMKLMKSLEVRVIYGDFYEPQGRRILCVARRIGMYGPKYVWLFPGWYQTHWWRVRRATENLPCTVQEMDEAVSGTFGVDVAVLLYDEISSNTASGLNANEYLQQLRLFTGIIDVQNLYGFGEAAYGYDTVWTAALALHEADKTLRASGRNLSIANFTYDNSEIGNVVFDAMNNLRFEGLTGPVKFSETGDRQGLLSLTQNQNGTDVLVAMCNLAAPEGKQLQFRTDSPIFWKDGKVPVDSLTEEDDLQVITFPTLVVVICMAFVGTALSVFYFVFNVIYRRLRIVKMSSPRINNLILFGGALIFISTVFMGLDVAAVSPLNYPKMCKTYIWLFVMGFTFAFGGMFAKTWRVHRIFTTKSVIPKRISDVNLFVKIGVLALLNASLLIIWETVDPIQISRQSDNPQLHPNSEDIIIIPVSIICISPWRVYWLGALFVINGILLVFGAFLAWETRKVTMPALNDSKQIGMIGISIYIVASSVLCSLPVSFVIQSPSVRFFLTAMLIHLATLLVLSLIFIPKIKSRNDVSQLTTMSSNQTEQTNHVPDE